MGHQLQRYPQLLHWCEYFYNQAGTTDPDNYLVTLARGDGTFLYLGQHYVAAYIVSRTRSRTELQCFRQYRHEPQ